MVYFATTYLIGNINSKEAYMHYLHISQWCTNNLENGAWGFDHSSTICINGINIPVGIKIHNFTDAKRFVDSV